MKAVVMHEHGGPEVLRYEEVPDPLAGPGEALVRVRACALNHLDIWTRIGQAGRMVTFPHILGNDIAGEVVSLRTPVEGIAPGERVMVSPGSKVVPQRKPGDSAISASRSVSMALQIRSSKVPLKLPRR